MSIDGSLLRLVDNHRNDVVNHLAGGTMRAGTSLPVLGVGAVGFLVLVLVTRQWRLAGAAAGAFTAATIAAAALKATIDRARPPAELAIVHLSGPSMPSTHAARTAAVAASIVLTARWRSPRERRVGALVLTGAVVAVGLCLVYLGVHWPSDVLVGWALGASIGAAIGVAARRTSTPGELVSAQLPLPGP